MGKTVLLRRCITDARTTGAVVVYTEASDAEPFSTTLRAGLERARRESASVSQKIKTSFDKAIATLPRASLELPHGLGAIALSAPHKDNLELIDALEDLNGTVRRHGGYLLFAVDEIQEASVEGLRDLIRFVHSTASTKQATYFLGAGLPNSREHLHSVRTYTERWRFFQIGLLTLEQTKDAIGLPARDRGVRIQPAALERLAEESAGYPFFVQEFASAAWLAHRNSTITVNDVERTIPGVRRLLEDEFYDARFRRLTPRERAYVLAMAELGSGPHPVGEVSARLRSTSAALSSIRNRLITKDVIYAPAGGMIEFRIPLMERYVVARLRPGVR